jgi:hypothetical protein
MSAVASLPEPKQWAFAEVQLVRGRRSAGATQTVRVARTA